MSWNDEGKLLVKGVVIPNTNISELLFDTFLDDDVDVEGSLVFYRALSESKLPSGLINNQRKRTSLEQMEDIKPPGKKNICMAEVGRISREV